MNLQFISGIKTTLLEDSCKKKKKKMKIEKYFIGR